MENDVRAENYNTSAVEFLRRLPGVSGSNYRAIMDRCRSLAELALLPVEQLAEIMDGHKAARILKDFLDAKYPTLLSLGMQYEMRNQVKDLEMTVGDQKIASIQNQLSSLNLKEASVICAFNPKKGDIVLCYFRADTSCIGRWDWNQPLMVDVHLSLATVLQIMDQQDVQIRLCDELIRL